MKSKFNLIASTMVALTIAAGTMSFVAVQGGWVVPAVEAAKKNPVKADATSIAAGKALYLKHCKMCHGATGVGGAMSGGSNFTTSEFKAQSDGAIFYKTNTGLGKMPSYKTKIADDTDKWHLVNYLKTL